MARAASSVVSPALAVLLLAFVASATVLPFTALIQYVEHLSVAQTLSDVWIQRVIEFSLWQATLSTLLSVGLAIPVAIALSREPRFPGRSTLLSVFSLSLVMPTLVAIFGIVAVFGRTGWVNQVFVYIGLPEFSLYGLIGILIAHVFFNLPLATRIFLVALDGIPPAHWRLAAQLGLGGSARIATLEWPAIRTQLIGTAILVFALCLTSFAIVLTLGGGPRATTIEVAIYQALRFDFDLSTAVSLALVQLSIAVAMLSLGSVWKPNVPIRFSAINTRDTWRPSSRWRALNASIITLASLFVLLPVTGLLASAINPALLTVLTHAATLNAFLNTLLVAISSASLAFVIAIGLLLIARHCHFRWQLKRTGESVRLLGNLILVMPPLVLGTGLFLLLRPYVDVFSLALLLVILINALLALPFVLRILEAPVQQQAQNYDRLVQSLGISGWSRFRLLDWPSLKPAAGLAFGIAASLSAGDLGAIALFGSDRVTTLPLLLYQRMGGYRMEEAAVTAVLLLLTCLLLFALSQWLVQERSALSLRQSSAHFLRKFTARQPE